MPINMAEYMRERRAAGLDRSRPPTRNPRVASRSAGQVHRVPPQPEAHHDHEFFRHTLRTGSLMYPERVTGDHWRPGAAVAEVTAALKRHDRRLAQ